MPGAISTPADRGFFKPGEVMQDAVQQYVQDQIRRQAEQRTQQQFSTEQAVREAGAAPQIDPEVIRQKVLAAQLGAKTGAANAGYIQGLPDLARIAMLNGHLPTATSTGTSFDPTSGAPVTQENQGFMDPNNGIYTPFGGSRTQAAPPVNTTTTIKPNPAGAAATPGLAIVRTEHSVTGANGQKIITGATEAPQRITPPHGDAALLDMAERLGVDPDDLGEAVQGLLNKKSATAPLNTNAPKSGTVESLNANLAKLQASLSQETDPAALKDIRTAMQNTQGRIDALNRQFSPKPAKPGFREALGLAAPVVAPNLNGTPAAAPAPGANGTSAQPTEATAGAPLSTPPTPAVPKTTPAAPSKPATTGAPMADGKITPISQPKYQNGTIYRDAQGKRAMWDGTQFVAAPTQ